MLHFGELLCWLVDIVGGDGCWINGVMRCWEISFDGKLLLGQVNLLDTILACGRFHYSFYIYEIIIKVHALFYLN